MVNVRHCEKVRLAFFLCERETETCFKGFSLGTPVFLPSQKSTLLNSNSIWKQWMKSHLMEMPLQIPIIIIIIIIIIIV